MIDHNEESALFERIVANQLQIAELQAENDKLKDFIRTNPELYPVGTQKSVGKFYVKVMKNERIDDALARKALGSDTYDMVAKTTLDTRKARTFLNEEDLAKITKTFEPKVEVGLR